MDVRTHLSISRELVGEPIEVEASRAVCRLTTTSAMAADDHGLVHGGFIFGLADYAAMVAVGDPNVVLGAADVRFLAPVRVGQQVVAVAQATGEGKKRVAEVSAAVVGGDGAPARDVFRGTFTCFVLESHVLAKESV